MNVIGFDTATDDTVVAATRDGEAVYETLHGPGPDGRPVHSGVLLTSVNEAAEALGGWPEVARLAVGTGPGTFTGIRIGLSTATGLSLSTGVELAAVSTLEALALPMKGDQPVLAVLDARRGEVFAALYGQDGSEEWSPFAASPAQLLSKLEALDTTPKVGGPGAVRFMDELTRAGVKIAAPEAGIHRLSGRSVCDLGVLATRAGQTNPLEPTYLRLPDAQIWLQRDRDPNGP